MKFLLDQHISFRLLRRLQERFPESKHVKDFDLTKADDEAVWQFAAENGFTIVSKDSDFMYRSLLRGHPPKVILIQIGNCPSSRILDVLLSNEPVIKDFEVNPVESLLILR